MATMQERVAERYPALIPLLKNKEVGGLLTRAVNENWSPGQFRYQFMATRWFRSQSEAQRKWWVLTATDPAEAKLQRNNYSAEIINTASALGIKLNSNEVRYITESGLSRGDPSNSARVQANLLAYGLKTGKMGAGSYATAARDVRAMETGSWFREPPKSEVKYWAAEIALGRKTMQDFNAAAAYTASHRWPHMAERIKAGETVAQIVGPAVEAYAREMDWDPQGVMSKMHTNATFAGLTGIRDPKTNQMRLPTEYEAQTMARSRNDWWGTTGGRRADASMALQLSKAFGRRA
jgi:hypothetical protein